MRSSLLLLILPLVHASPRSLPLSFEENRGQAASEVRFLAPGIFFTSKEAVVVLAPGEAVRIQPKGTAASAPDALEPLAGKSNYLNREPAITGVPHYGRIRYRSVYPGIDLSYYGRGNALEYDFAVAAGAHPERIRLTLQGAHDLRIDANGDLVVRLRNATFIQRKPEAWQAGRSVDVRYVLTSKKEVAFAIGAYDRTRPLIIDPLIDYATYLGVPSQSIGGDAAFGIAADSAGSAYVTGALQPGELPSTAPSSTTNTGFVAKFSPDGTQLIYSTYLNLPAAQAIAVDSQGSAYVAGGAGTQSGEMRYIVKLTPDGSALAYSYTFSAPSFQCCSPFSHLVLDSAQNLYAFGSTSNTAFPTTSGSYQKSFPGQIGILGPSSAYGFVMKLNPAGKVVYSTYLRTPVPFGGTPLEALAVDANQEAFVLTNVASSTGQNESILLRLNPSGGGALSTMTFPNSSSAILEIDGIATNSAGTLYASGFGALSANSAGNFVAELDASANFGIGHYIPNAGNVYVDGSDNAYVVGSIPGTAQGTGGFVTRVDSSFSTVVTTTPGFGFPDTLQAATVDPLGNVYLTLFNAASGQSPQFLATAGAYQTTRGAFAVVKLDAAVLALGPPPPPPPVTTPQLPVIFPGGVANSASNLSGVIAPGEIVTVYGASLGPAQLVSATVGPNGTLPTSLAGTTLLINGVPAPMLYSSFGQIAAIVPVSLDTGGPAVVRVEYQGMESPIGAPNAVAVSFPALFTSDGSGRGQGAILNQDGSVNSASNPAAAGSVVSLFCSGCGATTPPGIDGAVATSLAALANPLVVTIGGQTAQVYYAGSAPGLLNGAVQIDAYLPAGVTGNTVPVSVSVGGSPPIGPAVTLAVH